MRSVLFHILGIPVFAYGVAIAAAFMIGVLHIRRLAAKDGLKPNFVYDAATASMVAAMLGARGFHVVTEWSYYAKNPGKIVAIWEGGLTFYGGLLACLAVLPFVFRAHKLAFWYVADHFAPAIALGHGIVRLGCFMNGCCYGKPASWGPVFPEVGDGVHRQPSQLYEAAAGVAIFVFLSRFHPRRTFRGQVMLLYLLLYALSRFLIEFTRDDPRGSLWGLSTSQWLALGIAPVAGLLWRRLRRTRPMSAEAPAVAAPAEDAGTGRKRGRKK